MTINSEKELKSLRAEADFLFETSFEVCNKVGGIYTVLESKADYISAYYKDNYCLIGPYFADKAKDEFQKENPSEEMKAAFSELEKEGIRCHFGRWLIGQKPKVILIDFQYFWAAANHIKLELWNTFKIDSLNTGHDYDEPIVWSWAAGKVIEKLAILLNSKNNNKKIVAHFHEWISGAGLLYLKSRKANVKTVFTTHATTLGRTLAYNEVNFYLAFDKINPEEEAVKYGIKAKHQIECQTAINCDIFTTVSEITSIEAGHFLGRKADFLLLNGFSEDKLLTFEEVALKHHVQRERLKEFLLFYFFPYYSFDLGDTLFFFILGRYEFKAKGIDVFIKALAELNQQLINCNCNKTIVAFLWIPSSTKGINQAVLENKDLFDDIKTFVSGNYEEVDQRILHSFFEHKKISERNLFKNDFHIKIEKKMMGFKKEGLPPMSTHDLADQNDIILRTLKEVGLQNREQDRVKVVFSPIYITGHDGLLNLDYQESIEACHLGVFPSFYEPWGYTPLEAAAFGLASVTTDLSGFGKFCEEFSKDKKNPGVFILERFNKKDDEVVKSLSEILYNYSQLSHEDRVKNKIEATKAAFLCSWKLFIKNYIKAHNGACNK